MDIPWEDVQLFLAVAETGSLSSAAKRLKVGQPTVTRRLSLLEERLGYQLFRRQVSGAALTSAGEKLVAPAKKMAEWAGEIGRAAAKGDGTPAGIVRIAAPPGIAFDFLAPFAVWLKGKYPKLRLEVLSDVRYLDLARGEADLALRMRAADHADLVNVVSVRVRAAAFAAKSYAEKLPKKVDPRKLDWIAWAPPFEHVPPNPQLAAMVPGFVPSFTSDNYLVMWRAAEAGLGAMVLGSRKHRFSLPTTLVPLELDLGPHAFTDVHLVCAKSALDIPRVRVVADLIAKEVARLGEP